MDFKVNIDDVLFWMDAIRNSSDRDRTLESFWKGQVWSKGWLIDKLKNHVDQSKSHKIVIYGGWNGVLASLLFNSDMNIDQIISVDIDPDCKEIANTINKRYEMAGKFISVTSDMCDYVVEDADIVINTSCEHITSDQYDRWLFLQPAEAMLILQSNNYFDLDEHIRCATCLDDFQNQCQVIVTWAGELELPKYNRFMIIGRKKDV